MSSPEQYSINPIGSVDAATPSASPVCQTSISAKPLYDAGSVTLATVFGGALAGFGLIALNYRRMGKTDAAWKAFASGILITAALIGTGFFLNPTYQSVFLAIGISMIFGIRGVAQKEQGTAVEEHAYQGGAIGSRWAAFGIGIAGCLTAFIVGMASFYISALLTHS
jgi:uncharacterized membrane protein HdeD (DUF308 family)